MDSEFEGFGNLEDIEDIFKKPVNEKNHDKTLDINYTIRIRKKQVLTGIEKEFKVNKINMKLAVPKNIENGQVFVLRQDGKKKGKKYGNLYITVKVLNF